MRNTLLAAAAIAALIAPATRVRVQETEKPAHVTADTPVPDRYPYVVRSVSARIVRATKVASPRCLRLVVQPVGYASA